MAQLQVIVNRLNRRKSPVLDFADKSNVVDVVNKDTIFESDGEITNTLGTWYVDRDGYYYWGKGLSNVGESNQLLLFSKPFSDFWFDNLEILKIWSQFNERGENAKVLILDSGINTDIIQISSSIQEPLKNFVIGSNTIKNLDDECHGTHCSSIIAARSKSQFIGAAPACKLLIGKITDSGSLDDSTTMKNALKEFLKPEYDFDIISISQELYSLDTDLEDLINQHINRNKIVIASIGNDYQFNNNNFKRYPGCFKNCLSVGSCSNEKRLSQFSMNPTGTTIFCFGENIYSYQNSIEPKPLSGTSEATAIVAGVTCLIISWLKKNAFVYNHVAIKNLLIKFSIRLTDSSESSLLQPILIFNALEKFKKNGQKDLQTCIDSFAVNTN